MHSNLNANPLRTYLHLRSKRKDFTSQFGEDGIIEYFSDVLGDDLEHVCCEVGAGDGVTFSNVYTLWKEKGWKALLIDGDKSRFKKLESLTKGHKKDVKIFLDRISDSGDKTIPAFARRCALSLNNGLVIIDIDSIDSYIFEGIGEANPSICIVEYNNHIPPWVNYRDPRGHVFLRHSLGALFHIGNGIGYSLVGATITNAIFVRKDLAIKHNLDEALPEEAYPYADQHKNYSVWTTYVASQLITSYPVFLWKPSLLDKIYFKFRGLLRAYILRKEPYLRPSAEVVSAIRRSGLFV